MSVQEEKELHFLPDLRLIIEQQLTTRLAPGHEADTTTMMSFPLCGVTMNSVKEAVHLTKILTSGSFVSMQEVRDMVKVLVVEVVVVLYLQVTDGIVLVLLGDGMIRLLAPSVLTQEIVVV